MHPQYLLHPIIHPQYLLHAIMHPQYLLHPIMHPQWTAGTFLSPQTHYSTSQQICFLSSVSEKYKYFNIQNVQCRHNISEVGCSQ